MLPSLATLVQLEDRTDVENTNIAEAALADASALIRAVAKTTWVDAENNLTDVPDVIRTICLSAAIRRVNNPMGYASEQISQYSYRYSGSAAAGVVFLTDDEKKMIRDEVRLGIASIEIEVPGIKYQPGTYLPTIPDTGPIWVGDA